MKRIVTLYSGSVAVQTWVVLGEVHILGDQLNMIKFTDSVTGRTMFVNGTFTVEEFKNG